jgi:chromosome segregation ATPase
MRFFKKQEVKEPEVTETITTAESLAADLSTLRNNLEHEIEQADKLREKYNTECRQLALGREADVIGTKEQLDLVMGRIAGLKAEIAGHQSRLTEMQNADAEAQRKQVLEESFRVAGEQLESARTALLQLRVEYTAMPDRLRAAEQTFYLSLRKYNEAKQSRGGCAV